MEHYLSFFKQTTCKQILGATDFLKPRSKSDLCILIFAQTYNLSGDVIGVPRLRLQGFVSRKTRKLFGPEGKF